MPHGPRRFAKNSENTRHFRLVARQGKDPENGEEASPLVLEPFVPMKDGRHKSEAAQAEMLTIPESLQGLGAETFGLNTRGGVPEEGSEEEEYTDEDEEAKEAELDDDCYFPKDGYNYNQHLKSMSTEKNKVGGIVLKAPRKPGFEEEEFKDQEKALRIPEPVTKEAQELMDALAEAELYEEMEDDDLEELLPGGVLEPEVILWGPAALESADLPDLALFKAMHAERMAAMAGQEGEESEEEGCQGPPGAGAGETVSDAKLDQLLMDEYGDEEDGALSDEEIEGTANMEELEAVLDEYLETRDDEKSMLESLLEPKAGRPNRLEDDPRVTEETKAIIARFYQVGEEDADTSEGETEEESKNWDCESILSTLSNASNRPGKIGKIKVIKKKGPEKDLAAIAEKESDAESDEDDDAVELPDVSFDRPKNETPEEKKIRKNGVKEMRRICRKMKKESKDMYKQEAAKLANHKTGTGDIREKLRIMKL